QRDQANLFVPFVAFLETLCLRRFVSSVSLWLTNFFQQRSNLCGGDGFRPNARSADRRFIIGARVKKRRHDRAVRLIVRPAVLGAMRRPRKRRTSVGPVASVDGRVKSKK